MDFQLGHVISIAVMDLTGICVNCWFLYMVKTRVSQLNAIDILQACKAVLCLVALLVCVWTEFVTCTSKVCTGAKAISDDTFYFSTCLTFLAIAYVRYKACEYRGQASVMLTYRYAIKTLMICFVPVGMFAAANLSLMMNDRSSDERYHGYDANMTEYDNTELLLGDSRIAYVMCHLAFFVFIPIFISAVLYYRICNIVTQTARTMEGSMSSRKHDPSKLITLSVTVLMSTMLIIWGIYTIVRVVSLYVKLNEMFFLYWKLVVLIVQPSGEGMLHKSGKKSTTSRTQGRSTRQIYPISSVALSGTVIEEPYIGGRKLPALIEECETQVKSSNEKSDEEPAVEIEENNTKTFRVRRQSYIHPRASVLIRNAAMIGLEYQGKISNADFHTRRKTSEEHLRNELLNIEKDALQRHRTRRLSNCLRFTAADDSSCDEIYHTYKNLYFRRESKFSEKSRKSSAATSNVSDFDRLPNGTINERKERKTYTLSSGTDSPPRKRWKKLYESRTTRNLSELRNSVNPSVVEEEPTEILENKPSVVIDKGVLDRHDIALETGQHDIALEIVQTPTMHLEQQRLSLDSNLNQTLVSKPKVKSGKKRSISCINNVWMNNNQQISEKQKSVSFISSVELDGPSTSVGDPNKARSISYDSKIYLSYKKESAGKKPKVRHSHDHQRNKTDNEEVVKVEKWLTDRGTTREECIAKLMEMKEYF